MTNSLKQLSPSVQALQTKLQAFVENECHAAEEEYEAHLKDRVGKDRWTMEAVPPCMERLKNGEFVGLGVGGLHTIF